MDPEQQQESPATREMRIDLLYRLINRERITAHRDPLKLDEGKKQAGTWSQVLQEIPTNLLEVRFQQARATRKEQSNYPVSATEVMYVHNRLRHGWFWHGQSFDWFHRDSWTIKNGELVEVIK